MGQDTKLDMDEVLPEFGVTRREVDAEVKRRLAAAGKSHSTAEVREHFRRKSLAAAGKQTKKLRLLDR